MPRVVVVVDDSEQSAETVEMALLAIPDLAVHWYRDARKALAFLRTASAPPVCAIVTDLNMPRMDGFELIEQVRADQRYSRLPIVVLSADTDPATPERISGLGANAFFPKPFSPAEIRNKLEQLLHASG